MNTNIINFTKMHGCGNDYIFINCFDQDVSDPENLSKTLSDRHFSVGGDGLVLICPSKFANAKMRMFNSDGSEGNTCGNALRCVGKYLYDNKLVSSNEFVIETKSGTSKVTVNSSGENISSITVDMGKPEFSPNKIPAIINCDKIINRKTTFDTGTYEITCLSLGNPHCVIFCDNPDDIELDKIGSGIENDEIFPQKANIELVSILSENILKMRVWERGSGETLACGSGACAAAVAAVENGLCAKNNNITVKLRGGDLNILYNDDGVFMSGDAVKVFDGIISVD